MDSLINAAALRANLPQGPIRYDQLYAAFPFDNRRTSATMKPALPMAC